MLVIRFHDSGNEFESRTGFRFAPTKWTKQIIGDDDLIKICWNFVLGACIFAAGDGTNQKTRSTKSIAPVLRTVFFI